MYMEGVLCVQGARAGANLKHCRAKWGLALRASLSHHGRHADWDLCRVFPGPVSCHSQAKPSQAKLGLVRALVWLGISESQRQRSTREPRFLTQCKPGNSAQ